MNGKGVYYYSDGIREMGDFLNGHEIGIHLTLHPNGKYSINSF